MLAFVYEDAGKLGLKEVPEPRAKNNTGVIKVEASSICGTDLRAFRFGSSKIKPPRVIGHEVVGTVVEVGGDIEGFKTGDRVQIAPALGCGTCHYCKRGYTNLCDSLKTIGFDFDGTFAEYMEIPAEAFARDHVTKVPENLNSLEAVLAEPIACIVNAQSYLGIAEGDMVAVFGSGFIGTIHAALALQKGAEKAFMIEVNEERIKMAKKVLPELIIINSKKESLKDAIASHTNNRGVDVAITACSVGPAQVDAMNIIAKRGRISLFGGLPTETTGFVDSNIIHYKEVSVHGAHASTAVQNREVLNLIADGKLSVKEFVNNPFPLKDILKAFDALNREEIVKAILQPGVK
ncbi:MAG: alcohol dehydrogenase catalytic domain-containing protein [Treponema sp.]|jgi:L-iditol 2-dehydrogenase|nr:alcohol dehydrogenase catalytic domain-containing protein [Treponema sp.]